MYIYFEAEIHLEQQQQKWKHSKELFSSYSELSVKYALIKTKFAPRNKKVTFHKIQRT